MFGRFFYFVAVYFDDLIANVDKNREFDCYLLVNML